MSNQSMILQSTFGSVFSAAENLEEKNVIENNSRMVVVAGRVNNPGMIEIPENATLNDVIGLAGGIKNKKSFKAAQFGLPFGGFLTKNGLDKVIDFSLFPEGIDRNIIILSEEDCIVSFAKFYVEFLMSKIESSEYETYTAVKEEIEEHIEEHKCSAGQCIHLLKFRITDKCIGCTACARVCPVHCISGELKKKHTIDNTKCTHCGQCVIACPVSAIFEGDHTLQLLRNIATPNKTVVAQIAPAVRVAIGEAFGFEPGVNVEKKLVAALKKIGVDYVFDTSWAADLTVMEEATEFLSLIHISEPTRPY